MISPVSNCPVHSIKKIQRPKPNWVYVNIFFVEFSLPKVTSRAPMQFKWRASVCRKLAVCLFLKLYIRSLYHKNDVPTKVPGPINFKLKIKICSESQEEKNMLNVASETCQDIFKVPLRSSSTWSLQWVCKTMIPDSTYISNWKLWWLCVRLESH